MLRDDKSFPYIAVTVGDEYPRVMFTRDATAAARSTSGRTRTRRRCARRSTCSTASSGSARARARSPDATPASRASTSTSNAVRRPASGPSRRRSTASSRWRDRVPSGDTRSIAGAERRMPRLRPGSASRMPRGIATGFRDRDLAERQGADRRPGRSFDVIGLAVAGDRPRSSSFRCETGECTIATASSWSTWRGRTSRRFSRSSAWSSIARGRAPGRALRLAGTSAAALEGFPWALRRHASRCGYPRGREA